MYISLFYECYSYKQLIHDLDQFCLKFHKHNLHFVQMYVFVTFSAFKNWNNWKHVNFKALSDNHGDGEGRFKCQNHFGGVANDVK